MTEPMFKKDDWVVFEDCQKTGRASTLVNLDKSYRIERVRLKDNMWVVDLDCKEGRGWAESWFVLDKNQIVHDILSDL